jgi:hypothetical protein
MLGCFRRHHPEVKETAVPAQLYVATTNAANRAKNQKKPTPRRQVDYGLHVRTVAPAPMSSPACS